MNEFQLMNSNRISFLIHEAQERIILVAPSIIEPVALLLYNVGERLNKEDITIIIDDNPEVFRLGYGTLRSIELLIENGIKIKKVKNLRIGLLIVDNCSWLFTPTPEMIENEIYNIGLNCIELNPNQGEELFNSILKLSKLDNINQSKVEMIEPQQSNIEISSYQQEDLIDAKKDLELSPPHNFNFEKKVRVYKGVIQFVDLTLNGLSLNRRTLNIPSKLLGVTNDKDVERRLNATYKLIDENSKISAREIDNTLKNIRKKYLKSMGKRLGNIILLKNKQVFLEEINSLQEKVDQFQKEVSSQLIEEIEKTKKSLCEILVPGIMKNPPDELKNEILIDYPTEEIAKKYVIDVLESVLPRNDELINEMELNCDFKDVTYEMLNDKLFQSNFIKQFPYIQFDKPFTQFEAIELNENEEEQLMFNI